MKSVGWLRFIWEAKLLPETSYVIEEPYSIRRAARSEKSQVWAVIKSCFAQDACWNDVAAILIPRLHHEFEEKFAHHRDIDCLVITNGNRVIAASVVNVEVEAENHLSSGPCISSEYRNRGFGSLLLKESLLLAGKAGCPVIHGVTRATSPAAKFVYSKYHGKPNPFTVDFGQHSAGQWLSALGR
jgi:ribosomal protein S18 acetylase RimI-like enzyme